ncbi:MAG: hypothetical protein ABSC22_09140 [Roseiarcus sp.]|jgi:hypothetical protein
MTATASWRSLRGVEPRRLSEARVQAHYAVQWLARLARAALAPQRDDSHTNLGWDDRLDGFTTHALPNGARLGLRLRDLTLTLASDEPARPECSFKLLDHNDAEAREWLSRSFQASGFDAKSLDSPAPYALPAHGVARGLYYGRPDLPDALSELAAWFANGRTTLEKLRRAILAAGLDAPGPRCWPHHFDLATLTSFPLPEKGGTDYVGAGLSPGDAFYDQPYFYLSIYPTPKRSALPKLPSLGRWRVEEFTGAIVTAKDILASSRPEAETDEFLAAALEAALALRR